MLSSSELTIAEPAVPPSDVSPPSPLPEPKPAKAIRGRGRGRARGRGRGAGRRPREPSRSPSPPPTAEPDADEATNALIARMLADDERRYGGAYGGYQELSTNYEMDEDMSDEDDSYDPTQPSGRARRVAANTAIGGSGRGRRRKSAGVDSSPPVKKTRAPRRRSEGGDQPDADQDDGPNPAEPSAPTASPAPKRSKPNPSTRSIAVDASGLRSGGYLDDERARFVEALELYGRDWKMVGTHVRTRDEKSIRSHAQKHFIKLYRDNLPLPAKVQESGSGYTLSGQPLDPNSSTARAYLGKRTIATAATTPTSVTVSTATSSASSPKSCSAIIDAEPGRAAEEKLGDAAMSSTGTLAPEAPTTEPATSVPFLTAEELNRRAATTALPKPRAPRTPAPKAPAASPAKRSSPAKRATLPTPSAPEPSPAVDPPAPTVRSSYAQSRLRSSRARTTRLGGLPDDTDPLSLVKCTLFHGAPATNGPRSQPFTLRVHSNSQVGMDFHAHLSNSEIIGFLAGTWCAATRALVVHHAFPCRALRDPDQNASVNVEMDPTSEFEVRQQIRDRDLQVVGWYHSHPCFLPDPSLVDLENQCNYQNLFRQDAPTTTGDSGSAPFVGAIVGPYDPDLPGSVSFINWFYVDTRAAPSNVSNDVGGGRSIDFAQVSDPSALAKKLTFTYAEDDHLPAWQCDLLLALLEQYRTEPGRPLLQETWKPGSAETRRHKLVVSLAARMSWVRTPAPDATGVDPNNDAGTKAESSDLPADGKAADDASTDSAATNHSPSSTEALANPLTFQLRVTDEQVTTADKFLGQLLTMTETW
ncbi:hypothetical protein IWQ60_000385 [Tieghemiomyces parasiticus]|uniref:Myb-like, SWIRM and MPN domain-containing protein 1 n=1 Tax=Tieghemiomyces parasiticus TaxID=78921 RepID=A0A9W8AG17_9FUNG|nr:hypothetical protein IWQ60_000385 [Tieghemiomyces parasiticus]